MDAQRLRNLTTGRLHTAMTDIYADIEYITGEEGIMTHHLGMACAAMKPYLKQQIKDVRFWDDEHDPTHIGDYPIKPMSIDERKEFFNLFNQQPNPLIDRLSR